MESNVKWVTHNNATVTVLVKFREPTITPWCFGCHVISNDIVRDLKQQYDTMSTEHHLQISTKHIIIWRKYIIHTTWRKYIILPVLFYNLLCKYCDAV